MTRIRAALTHLLISATLSAIVICLLLFGWYPLPFFWALGGLMLLILIVGIDVVLGPVMTLILFNPEKSRRELILDLSLIAIVQISALGYGLYSGYVSRLVYGVFDGKVFQLVQASEIPPKFVLEAKRPEFRSLSQVGHGYIATVVPDTEQAASDMTFFRALGVGPQNLPDFYVPLSEVTGQLRQASIPIQQLQSKHASLADNINDAVKSAGLAPDEVAVVPFNVRTSTYTAVVNMKTVTMLKVIAENPD